MLGATPVKLAVGCRACAGTGYLGQLPLSEVLVMTPGLKSALAAEPDDVELLRVVSTEGMRTFTEVGLERVSNGETTFEEIERVLGIVPVRDETAASVGPVLVVDDESQDLLLVSATLRKLGFDVVEADGGPRAQELIKSGEHDFCMVVMDLFMPEVDGTTLLRTIRQSLSTQTLPVIVLTSSGDPRDELAVLEAGADDFLLKPIVVERLEARVRAVLRRSGVRVRAPDEASVEASWRSAPSD